ncbi:MAG: F0F1 ATP synthase subunit delta [Candidatus Didemnitutus sp.]|nr:F0F1 ATP synthase subunit delta [Candidatus Didemnitutus sp.]
MAASKKTKLLAKQLLKLSLENGEVSPALVGGVLGWIEKHAPRQSLALLKAYHRQVATELAKSRALVEHAGPVSDATLKMIEGAMSQKYHRLITAVPQPNASLLAGLRVRVASDVYESTVAGQLANLSASV